MTRRYDLLALDLDGTLLGPDGRPPKAHIAAVTRARAEGVLVVVCTGRGYAESKRILDAIGARGPRDGPGDPVIVAGGAMVADAASGRTLHRWPMDPNLVERLCDHFAERTLAPLLLKDRDAAGFDYLVVNSGPMEAPTRWWFQVMDVEVKFVDHVAHDEHPEQTIRVGFAAHAEKMLALASSVGEAFGGETTVQHFAAVSGGPDDGDAGAKDDAVHLLEVFDRQVSKWTAIRRVAAERGVSRDRIAAIGDEVNDVAMLEGAALGVAMGNAVDAVKAVADRCTLSNAEHGVAHAIDRILAGAW